MPRDFCRNEDVDPTFMIVDVDLALELDGLRGIFHSERGQEIKPKEMRIGFFLAASVPIGDELFDCIQTLLVIHHFLPSATYCGTVVSFS